MVLIGGYELRAGEHAAFGSAAWAVPLTLGPYVIWTWTDPRADRRDELAAVALLAASIVLSVAAPPAKWQALGIGLVLIVVEWRQVARGREWLARRDDLAAARQRASELAAAVAELRRDLAAAEWRAEAARAASVAASGASSTTTRRERPWGDSPASQVAWLVEEMRAGRTEWTGEAVAERMGLGSAKTGRDRLRDARRVFRPVWPVVEQGQGQGSEEQQKEA